MIRLLTVLFIACLAGCSGNTPAPPSTEQNVAAKVEAMQKIVTLAEGPNAEGSLLGALEKYRSVPFDAKAHPAEAKKILEMYEKIKSKLTGDAALYLKGEMTEMEKSVK